MLVWGVNPVALVVGPVYFRWYALFFLAGILGGYSIVKKIYAIEKRSPQRLRRLAAFVVVGSVIGMRLGHCLLYEPGYYLAHPTKIVTRGLYGQASHGAIVGLSIALWLYVRTHNNKEKGLGFLELLDRLGIAITFCGGCVRVGNFFNSEIVGLKTEVPWAVTFTRIDHEPRHPAQIYEAVGYFVTSAFLYQRFVRASRSRRDHSRTRRPGFLTGAGLVMCFVWRFGIEFFKENQVLFENAMWLNLGQVLSVPLILVGVALVL